MKAFALAPSRWVGITACLLTAVLACAAQIHGRTRSLPNITCEQPQLSSRVMERLGYTETAFFRLSTTTGHPRRSARIRGTGNRYHQDQL